MRKIRGVLSICMALIFAIAMMLTGCSGANNQNATTSQKASVASSDQAASAATEPALPEVKLSYYMLLGAQQRDQDAVFAEANKYLKEKINATVDFIPLEWGNYEDKTKTMVAANDPFDVMWDAYWYPGTIAYSALAQNGTTLAIDDLLDKYAPNTKAAIPQNIWDLSRVNGKIYGVPCYQIMFSMYGMWVKKDLADKYGFNPADMKTYADLVPFMDKVKAGEPGITPILANTTYLWWFDVGYGPQADVKYKTLSSPARCFVREDNPKTVVADTDPERIQNALAQAKVAREWYEKGYVRKDMFSIKDIDAEAKTGKYAIGFGTYKPGGDAEYGEKVGFPLYFVPTQRKPTINKDSATATMLSISAGSKNPERAMMFIDLLTTDKYLFNLMANGIENKNYIKTGDNTISRVENNGYQPNMDWAMGNTFLAYITPGKSQSVIDDTMKMNSEAEIEIMTDWAANNDTIKNETAIFDSLWKQTGQPLMAGVLPDVENAYKAYMSKMEKAGMAKVKAEMQKQLDAYWASHSN